MSGTVLLTFMTIHLFHFRFGWTDGFAVGPTNYFINVAGNSCPHMFYAQAKNADNSLFIGVRVIALCYSLS